MNIFKAVEHAIEHAVEFIDSRNKIDLALSRYSYVGGDRVEGTVHLHCEVPFTAKGVLVKVRGYELASWEEWKTREKHVGEGRPPEQERYLHVHKESKEFFKDSIRVYPHTGVVQPGEYNFPFAYQLPASLPGTFYEHGGSWNHGTGYIAEIIYFAKAKIDVQFKHDLKKKVNFVINEKFDQSVQPSFSQNSKTFLFTKGKLDCKVWLDKNVYFPGNTVIARMEANNTSVKPTNRLNVIVYKHLQLHAGGHHWEKRHEIYKQQYKGFEPSFFGVRWLPFQVPLDVQPSTTTSHLVKCHYYFVVECDIPGAIDLRVELATSILAPQWLFSTHPQPPPMIELPPDASYRPPWQPDSSTDKCNKCAASFSLFNRRHHCRHCGKVFCSKCTTKTCKIPNLGYDEAVKVCDTCYQPASSGGTQFQTAVVLPTAAPQEYGAVPPSAPPMEVK
jgi:hypothetical protein